MFCSYCGYGQLPSNAVCCYMCGKPGPYFMQPLSIEKSGLPRLPGECPKCRSQNTVSGANDFKKALSVTVVVGIFTIGIGLIFTIPYGNILAIQMPGTIGPTTFIAGEGNSSKLAT